VTDAADDPLGLEGIFVEGRWLLERAIGRGGAAVVYRARDATTGGFVAVKFLVLVRDVPPEVRPRLLADLEQEGRLARELSDAEPGVVRALGIGALALPDGIDLPYLVLEWLEGASLDVVLVEATRRGLPPRSLREALRFFDPVVRALEAAHARAVSHRDLKPENVYVVGDLDAPRPLLKLLDFGVAKRAAAPRGLAELARDMQRTGLLPTAFTPHYGAPEQFDRAYGETGPHSDVFALALVLIEIAQGGRRAMRGRVAAELERESKDPERRPTPRAWGLEVSDAVEAVFERAVAVRSEQRYANASEFRVALEAAFEADTHAAQAPAAPLPPPASPALDGPSMRRSPWLRPSRIVALAIGIALALVVAAAFTRR
jgi:serine/threonine protein kinase